MSAFGLSERSISALGTSKGVTFPTYAAGSGAVCVDDTRRAPAVVPNANGHGWWGIRRSFARAASIAAAAASPAAIPPALAIAGVA